MASGTYLDTERVVTASPGHAGLDVTIASSFFSYTNASFTVTNIVIDYSGDTPVLLSLSVSFALDDGIPDVPALFGTFNYNYTPAGPAMPDAVIENAGEGIDTVVSAVSYVLTAEVENLTLTGSLDISGTGNVLNNAITGNYKDNVLNGAAGDDTLAGDSGNDTFNVMAGEGSDVIQDFLAGAGVGDVANLDGFTLNTFSAVQAAMSQNGANTVLDLGNGQTLTFLNLAPQRSPRTISRFSMCPRRPRLLHLLPP